jgi:branched-chain amino acid transport system substrate-binding protein
MLWGAWDHKAPGLAEYRKRHMAMYKRDSEHGAAGVYATMQILQKAVETVGEINRPKIRDAIAAGTFQTVGGEWKFKDQLLVDPWAAGQWQNGEVVGVLPAHKKDAQPIMFPKPKW